MLLPKVVAHQFHSIRDHRKIGLTEEGCAIAQPFASDCPSLSVIPKRVRFEKDFAA